MDPTGALVSTDPLSPSVAPDTSTNPPSPPCGPPLALIAPSISVSPEDSTATRPPDPSPVESAAMLAPASILTVEAIRAPVTDGPPLARLSVVPTATTPPPARPEALNRAVEGGGDVHRRIRDESAVIPIECRVALKELEWLPAIIGEEIEK